MHVISARLLRKSSVLLINAYFTIAFTLKFNGHSHMNYFINDGLRGHNRSRFEMNDKKLASFRVCRSLPQEREVTFSFVSF